MTETAGIAMLKIETVGIGTDPRIDTRTRGTVKTEETTTRTVQGNVEGPEALLPLLL